MGERTLVHDPAHAAALHAPAVIGAVGLIGSALSTALRRHHCAVTPITRRELDLASDVSRWRPPTGCDVAFLCAGVASMRQCRLDPRRSRLVNVEHTLAVARRLVEGGAFVVFLSTNQVFDGSTPRRRADETPCPVSEYGRQKADAEAGLLELGDRAAVVRLTKVLGPGTPLLTQWRDALRRGQPVRAFADMLISPVPLDAVVETLILVARLRRAGVTQMSNDRDVTYSDVARHVARRLGVEVTLVESVSAASADIPPEETPRHTTLDTDQKLPGVGDVIDAA